MIKTNHARVIPAFNVKPRGLNILAVSLSALAFAACQHIPQKSGDLPPAQEQSLNDLTLSKDLIRPQRADVIKRVTAGTAALPRDAAPSVIGRVPVISDGAADTDSAVIARAPRPATQSVEAIVAPLSVPKFLDVVFGDMLKVPFVVGPAVAQRTDVIQLRSSGTMKSGDFLDLVSMALEDYGIRVLPDNGTYRIVEDKVLYEQVPRFIKTRARASTRADLRPVIQFIDLQALDSGSMLGFLRQAFGRGNEKLKFDSNPRNNYISITGLPSDVNAALAIIDSLDELTYAGQQVKRYTPRYWQVAELATALETGLAIEGWQVTQDPTQRRGIYLYPVEYTNDLFVFTKNAEARERVDRWFAEFDRPISGGDTAEIFIYQVRNVDAEDLAATANRALAGQSQALAASAGALAASGGATTITAGEIFTPDLNGNRIIFSGTTTEYDKYIRLLEALDTPVPEVLLELQIAEVTLSDGVNTGVEFSVDQSAGSGIFGSNDRNNNTIIDAISTGGLGLGSTGLNIDILDGDVDAQLNAFANNRRVKLLSTPIVVARSGGAAELQVGSDVPIITSQRADNAQNGGGALDVLQSIDYRSTGVILSLEPIVFSDDRIDLTISQEVSSTLDTANSGIASPTISNRAISTQLSLEDGATAVLGGLIQENVIRNENGVPFLKDIPIVGQAFSADAYSIDRTELVVLIRAYVLRNQADRAPFVNALRQRSDAVINDNGRLLTLRPKNF